jgi:phage/plasmid-associated DNA primase
LEGARKVEKFGFVIPDVCRQAVEEYRREAVPEIAFFEENYEAGDDEDRVKCDDLRANYERWCRRQGCGAKSTKKLAKTMAKLYPRCERKRGRDGSTLCYFYHGLREINTLGY